MIALVCRNKSYMQAFPRSVIFVDFMLTFIICSGLRLFFRLLYYPQKKGGKRIKVLVIGAGSAAEQLVRDMLISPASFYDPVGLIDDDADKYGSYIHGICVLGGKEEIPSMAQAYSIEEIIICIPSATSFQLRIIMEYVRASEIKNVKMIPGLSQLLTRNVTLSNIRELSVEDLLSRNPVVIDMAEISFYIKDKSILVTGAGGSIGSELCRQIARFEPACLIMVDMGETELFYIEREMRERFPKVPSIAIIADIKDAIKMGKIFMHHLPKVIFHAAAYKHVPLMELNPREAVLNNIEGTRVIAKCAIENKVEKFVFISTDKAVNPAGIMGMTKRVCENLIRSHNSKDISFISVRFGNVLESRGSVVPIFKEQIKQRKAVTITHPDMQRYLMSISEAVQLVLQAGALGSGGEVFMLDMGEPIRIVDLANYMIRFYGLEPDKDIPIIFTGKRPGEKLLEELLTDAEGMEKTKHNKIFIARSKDGYEPEYISKIENLIEIVRKDINAEEIMMLLKELIFC